MIKETPFLGSLKVFRERPAVDAIKRNDAVFKLDRNESPFTPPPAVLKSISDFLRNKNSVNWYGDGTTPELRKAIASYCGMKSDQILVTNGSDQAAELIANTFLREGDEVVIPVPTFETFFTWPAMRGCRTVKLHYDIRSGIDIKKIIGSVSKKTKLIYLVNPYIFTLKEKDIAKIAKAVPDAVVFVDEAYVEFYGKSSVGLTKKYKNIIVTRTFSKCFMLAGLRVGYIVAGKEVVGSIEKVRARYSANAVGQAATLAALKNKKYAADFAKAVRKSAKYVKERLEKMGFEVITTNTCFVLLKHGRISAERSVEMLEKKKVFVRQLNDPAGYIRMNLGTPAMMKKVIAIFEKVFGNR